MLIKHSLGSARAKGIRTLALVEYYSDSQFSPEIEYEVGVLSGGKLVQEKVLQGDEASVYAEKLMKYLGKATPVYFKESGNGELAYIVSVSSEGSVTISPEPSEVQENYIKHVVGILGEETVVPTEYHLIFHYDKNGEDLILFDIKYIE